MPRRKTATRRKPAAKTDPVADALQPLYHLEDLADNLELLARRLDGLASAVALHVIAQYGSQAERAKAVAHLKSWFSDSGAFS